MGKVYPSWQDMWVQKEKTRKTCSAGKATPRIQVMMCPPANAVVVPGGAGGRAGVAPIKACGFTSVGGEGGRGERETESWWKKNKWALKTTEGKKTPLSPNCWTRTACYITETDNMHAAIAAVSSPTAGTHARLPACCRRRTRFGSVLPTAASKICQDTSIPALKGNKETLH